MLRCSKNSMMQRAMTIGSGNFILFCFCFVQLKPEVEIFFSDVTDVMKKQNKQFTQLIQVIIISWQCLWYWIKSCYYTHCTPTIIVYYWSPVHCRAIRVCSLWSRLSGCHSQACVRKLIHAFINWCLTTGLHFSSLWLLLHCICVCTLYYI